jgi:chemotaxis protein CheX
MEIGQHDIYDIVRTIWDAVLGWEIQPSVDARLLNGSGSFRTGIIQIAGAWEGAVVCSGSEELMRRAAAVVFQTPQDVVTIDMVQDALMELVNMIGGNVKALLPGPSYLSLPEVVEGSNDSLYLPASQPIVEAKFLSQGQPWAVRLLARSTTAVLPA